MSKWADMGTVKSNLWKKLHSAKEGVLNLAQIISVGAVKLFAKPADDSFVQMEDNQESV